MLKNWSNKIVEISLVFLALLLFNVLANYKYGHIDLTEDKRFTLSESTKELVKGVDDNILVQVLMDGDLAAGFKRLRSSCMDLMIDFNSINPNIEYEFYDPMDGPLELVNQRMEQLKNLGITPMNIRVMDGKESVEKFLFPYAILKWGSKRVVINLIESQRPGVPNEIILNNSASLLEYKMADALYRLTAEEKPNIVFVSGNGELDLSQTAALEKTLKDRYNTARLNLDSLYQITSQVDLLVVAKPQRRVSERSQFIIDQYIMNGGKVIWLIDQFAVNVDSINASGFYVPRPLELGLNDLFFKYGVKIKPNLVLDLECTRIPQVTGQQGQDPQIQLFDWFYHPLVAAENNHPITKNIDLVNLFFPSTIDTVKSKSKVKKSALLRSSEFSRFQLYPMRLNFEILRYDPDESKFNKGQQNLAILAEGEFESAFTNRVGSQMNAMLEEINLPFKAKSPNTTQLFVSDGDLIKNFYNSSNQQISPVGFNIFEQKAFKGNQDFIINAIDYMTDDIGLMNSRSKEIKLHLLNTTKAKKEKRYWQLLNIVLPLLILLLFALIFNVVRRRRFTK